jgi:hypothetical protein
MADEAGAGAQGIPKRFLDLSADVREERLVRYVIKQLGQGRHMDDIMKDDEVMALSSATSRTELMENPAVLKALEQQLKSQFSSYSAATAKGTEESDADGKLGPGS